MKKQKSKSGISTPMSAAEFEEAIRKILVESFHATAEQVVAGTKFRRDLNLDEYQAIEFAGALEERFGISIDSDAFDRAETIGELTAYLQKALL